MNYAADLSPRETWALMQDNFETAVLVDVRTRAEWSFVGLPVTDDKMNPVVPQEWQVFPTMEVNSSFASTLKDRLTKMDLGTDAKLCFLCRSGVRSQAAASAMTEHGYANTFNVTGGFEGDPDAHGHRGTQNGWKADGLPWRQN